jgi:hypothetical protein
VLALFPTTNHGNAPRSLATALRGTLAFPFWRDIRVTDEQRSVLVALNTLAHAVAHNRPNAGTNVLEDLQVLRR